MDMWIAKVDDIATTYNWPAKVIVNHALPKLRGTALTWYTGLSTINRTWIEWKTLLKEWFSAAKGTQKRYEEMVKRVRLPTESVEVYYHDKVAKARACGTDDAGMIDYLIIGLHEETLIMALSTRDYSSPQELLRFVKQMDERVLAAR